MLFIVCFWALNRVLFLGGFEKGGKKRAKRVILNTNEHEMHRFEHGFYRLSILICYLLITNYFTAEDAKVAEV